MSATFEWASAIPYLIGGGLSIIAGIVAQLLASTLSNMREQKKFRYQKAEELICKLNQLSEWLEAKRRSNIDKRTLRDEPNPFTQARALQRLHFPELQNEIALVGKSATDVIQAITDGAVQVIEAATPTQISKLKNPVDTQGGEQYLAIYKSVSDAIHVRFVSHFAVTEKVIESIVVTAMVKQGQALDNFF